MTRQKDTKSVKENASSKRRVKDETFVQWLLSRFALFSGFKGNWYVVLGAVLLGILFPPAMSFAVMYLAYRTFPKRPRIFDRHLLIFIITMVLVSLISLSMIGLALSEVLRMTFWSTLFTILLGYPFVFSWLWFDWEYGLNANRKQ